MTPAPAPTTESEKLRETVQPLDVPLFSTIRFLSGDEHLVTGTGANGFRCDGTVWPFHPPETLQNLQIKRPGSGEFVPLLPQTSTGSLQHIKTPWDKALDAIAGERAYQEQKWPGHSHSVAEWLLILEKLMTDARRAWVCGHGNDDALHEVRQIAATAVACMEQCGALMRQQILADHPSVIPDSGVPDWSPDIGERAPEWANYFARDRRDIHYWYAAKPTCTNEGWRVAKFTKAAISEYKPPSVTCWMNCLVKRPAAS